MRAADETVRNTVGILGLGAFGRLIAVHLRPYFQLYGYDPALPPGAPDGALGLILADAAAVAGCDVVVLATPVDQLGAVIDVIRPNLRAGSLVMDVGSVKVLPARIMAERLPDTVEIIGSHPLFGPQSARDGIAGLKLALCPIRGDSVGRVAAFMRARLGLSVFVTTAEAHDREAATVQGLTHLIAKVLVQMEPLPTRMTTRSFDMLVKAVDMVRYDAPEVFLAIEKANPYSAAVRKRFFQLAADLDESLRHDEA